jgi:hypothetical protein
MSGVEEQPDKWKEQCIAQESENPFMIQPYPESRRKIWKFGVFDKAAILFGLIYMCVSTLYLISIEILPAILWGIAAAIWFYSGCVKRVWAR